MGDMAGGGGGGGKGDFDGGGRGGRGPLNSPPRGGSLVELLGAVFDVALIFLWCGDGVWQFIFARGTGVKGPCPRCVTFFVLVGK